MAFAINPPNVAIVNPATGKPTSEGYKFFLAIQRTIGEGLVAQIQDANYLTYDSSDVLTNGKVLTAGTGITLSSGAGTYTVGINTSVVVTRTGTQTLTNKTLTSPVINGGTIDAVTIGATTPGAGKFSYVTATVVVYLPPYAVADLPVLLIDEGAMAYVTDEAGGPVPAFFDGADWRRVTDRTIVS